MSFFKSYVPRALSKKRSWQVNEEREAESRKFESKEFDPRCQNRGQTEPSSLILLIAHWIFSCKNVHTYK